MEKLIQRYGTLTKALATLEKPIIKIQTKTYTDYEESRDSMIQRFEYCTDTFWKYLKDFLSTVSGKEVEMARPKLVLKECKDLSLISTEEYEKSFKLIEDRNLTSHGYNEETAEEISRIIPEYYVLMTTITERLWNQRLR
jgi:nucleotidyltransferase substrate binding protein (TIGR01987 family)